MYEVKYSLDGIVHTIYVNGKDAEQVDKILTSMFIGQSYQIIDMRRV